MDNREEETASRNDSLVAFVLYRVVALDYSKHLTCRICIRHFCLCHSVDEN